MTTHRRLIALVTVAIALAIAPAGPAAAAVTPKVSLLTVESQVMCPSCHEPLEAAQSPQAIAEKQYIQQLIDRGLTLQQIESQLVAQYGVTVLGKPPADGFNLTVYILPPLLLVLGIGGLLYTLPKWRARARAQQPLPAGRALTDDESDRLDQDLARFI